jgi:hypothetical protein
MALFDEPADALPGPSTPARTQPLDEAQREAWFEGPDVVTALRIYDGDVEYELPRQATVTLGASRRCDVHVPDRGLSALHCLLERKGGRFRVHDQHSTNGLFSWGRRVETCDVYPGDTFTPAPLTFLAMNEEMRAQRPIIAEIIGTGFSPSPDRILAEAVKHAPPLLLTAEPGCETDRLARAIHAVSLRRSRPVVEIAGVPADRARQREILKRAARSTLVIDLYRAAAPLDPAFCSMVFSRDHHVRVIALAPSRDAARRMLAIEHPEHLQHIWIRPLGLRPGDIPDLLDRMLAAHGSPRRLADLTQGNRDVLCVWEWRDNLAGLRAAADRLDAIARVPGWEAMDWRERAVATGIPKSTLHDWFATLGLTLPLFT